MESILKSNRLFFSLDNINAAKIGGGTENYCYIYGILHWAVQTQVPGNGPAVRTPASWEESRLLAVHNPGCGL